MCVSGMGQIFGDVTCWGGDWSGSMNTRVWEVKKSPPGCTPPLFIHLFELHTSAGTAGNRPRPQPGGVGLGLSQLAVQMAANGGQHKQEGGFKEWERGHCWDFLCGGFNSLKRLLEPWSQDTISARYRSEMEMGRFWPQCLILFVKFSSSFYYETIFSKMLPTPGTITVSLVEFLKITLQDMQIWPHCWKQGFPSTN